MKPLQGALTLVCALAVTANAADPKRTVAQILETTGIQGGLIVHVGCSDGKLTAALHANDSFLVHGLDAEEKNVAAARKHVQSLGLYGKVSIDHWDGKRLPYADNLVNLILLRDGSSIERGELLRVLAPKGVALAADPRSAIHDLPLVKPVPKEVDEWTHFLHDASGNPVAHDTIVGPPRHIQWIEDPRHARSHEHTPSVAAVVSCGGRVFYIVDEAPAMSILHAPQWHLVARDAYNGVLLWKRPIAEWWPHICGWTSGPRQLQRKLVAVGDRVFAAIGLHAPLSILDAATGKTLQVCQQTAGTEEIVCHDGILLLAIRQVTDERTLQLAKWTRLSTQPKSPLYDRDTAAPLLKQFRATEENAEMTIMALDAATGRELWKKAGAEADGLRPLTLCATGRKAFCQTMKEVVCLELATGKNCWSVPASRMRMVSGGGVICADGGTVSKLSTDTGKMLWSQDSLLCDIKDTFAINGSLWLGGFKPWQGKKDGKRGPVWGPYFVTQCDLATGERLKHIEPENPGHHHRCYPNKATDRYILGGRRGTEFIDLQTGEVLWHSWARGVCMYGVMPCNGLFYVPPHACGCYIAAKLTGFYALAAGRTGAEPQSPSVARLERGPAYASISRPSSPIPTPSDWPTYRGDAARSGTTAAAVPATLKRLWQADVGGKLTAPTMAGGKVFVGSVDAHRVYALEAVSGRLVWDFTAGGRVDSPPTLCGQRAIFGSRDGCVYSLRASDGALAWRLQAGRDDRRIVAHGQLESASPVHGSVLIRRGAAYVTAGRSSYLDGGIDLCRIEPHSGKLLSRTPIFSPAPKSGKQPPHDGPGNMPGALSDILASDDEHVYLRDMAFGLDGRSQTAGKPHLLTLTGFLDDTWPHRSYWIFGTSCSLATGCTRREKDLVYGRLLAFNAATIYGYGRQNVHWSNQLQDGPYRVFAVNRADGVLRWEKPVPIQVRAMVLAGNVLFVAGPPVESADPAKGPDAREGTLLLALSTTHGAELARCPLAAPPVFDGIGAANRRLYLSATDGTLVCLAANESVGENP